MSFKKFQTALVTVAVLLCMLGIPQEGTGRSLFEEETAMILLDTCPQCPPIHSYFGSTIHPSCDSCNGKLNLCVYYEQGQTTSGFTFNWSGPNGFASNEEDLDSLCAGTYTVTITDGNGNTATNSTTLQENCECNIWGWIDQTQIGCEQPGIATVEGYNGVEPYHYQWSNGSTSDTIVVTTPGWYYVTITDSAPGDCFSVLQVYFNTPGAAINVSANPAVICVGSSSLIKAITQTGNGPFTYQWSNGVTAAQQWVTPNVNTTYTVTVTEVTTGCTSTGTVTVTVKPLPNVVINGPSDICVGETVALTATGGGTGSTYTWSTGWVGNTLTVNPGSTTTYIVTVTNANGCTKTASKTVNVHHADHVCLTKYVCEWDDVHQDTIGTFMNQWGCDSTVIVSYQLGPSQTTVLPIEFSCELDSVGVFQIPFLNPFGCDSLVIRTVSLAPSQTTVLPIEFSCELDSVGVFQTPYPNPFGCDSLVIRTVSLAPSQTTVLPIEFSCELDSVGVFQTPYPNPFGCDSLVIRTVSLAPSQTTVLPIEFSCELDSVGVFQTPYPNPFGCDSLVIRTVSLAPSQTTVLPIEFSCELDSVGVFQIPFLNPFGCDSLVIRTVMFGGVNLDGITTNVTCNGLMDGSIHLNIFSQDSISDIFWSNGFFDEDLANLSAGTYSVTITTEAGCEAIDTFIINEPLPLTLTSTVKNPTCFGSDNGLLDVQGIGGTAPYVYAWSNGSQDHLQQDLGAEGYSVTIIDANGCQTGTSFQLIQPDSIVLSGILQPTSCEGLPSGAIDLTATGGSGTFSYDWSDFFSMEDRTGLSAGQYAVTVTDENGCKADSIFSIKENGCSVWYAYNQLHVVIGRCGELPTFDFKVTIYDISGKVVKNFNGTAVDGYFDGTFDVSSLTPGIYFVTIIGENDEVRHGSRFIKN